MTITQRVAKPLLLFVPPLRAFAKSWEAACSLWSLRSSRRVTATVRRVVRKKCVCQAGTLLLARLRGTLYTRLPAAVDKARPFVISATSCESEESFRRRGEAVDGEYGVLMLHIRQLPSLWPVHVQLSRSRQGVF